MIPIEFYTDFCIRWPMCFTYALTFTIYVMRI